MRPHRLLFTLIIGGLAPLSLCAPLYASGAAKTFAALKDTAFAGADFELDLAASDAASCQNACTLSESCCAYTFASTCRLKFFAAAPTASTGSVSGAKGECNGKAEPPTVAERLKGKKWDLLAQKPKQDSYWRTLQILEGASEPAFLLSAQPFERRVLPMPMDVLDFMRALNVIQGYSEVPLRAELPADYTADFRAALASLPDVVKKKVSKKLKAVLLAADVGTTGMSDSVVDDQGRPVSAFTVIDVLRTNVKANAWARSKEISPFKQDADETLTAEIEDPPNDTRINAIQYILLHEFGHVLAIGENLHPRWDMPLSTSTHVGDYPFFDFSWTISADGHLKRRYTETFAGLSRIRFYHQDSSELSSSKMEDVYNRLEKTDFATLYGSTNPFDDFAEAFASYVHTVMMKRPYRIKISKAGKPVKTYGSCWEAPRCAEKRKIIEALLAQ